MPDTKDILVGNLTDALGQTQRFVVWGIVSAALILLLSMDAPELVAVKQRVDVPILGKVAPGPASIILWLAYVTFGLLANSAVRRIAAIASQIKEVQIVEATLMRFSLVTIDSSVIRIAATLLAPLMTLVGYLLEQARDTSSPDIFAVTIGFLVTSAPYLLLAYRLRRSIGKVGP